MSACRLLAFGAVVYGAAIQAVLGPGLASAAVQRATCDQIPGKAEFASSKWRVFRTDAPDPGTTVPLYACERTARATTSLVKISLPYDDVYGVGTITRIDGDVATFLDGGRYGSSTTYVDLRTLRVLRGSSSSHDPAVAESRVLLGSGALVTFASRYGADSSESQQEVPRNGSITVADSSGNRVVAAGSVFSNDGRSLVTPVDGPYDIATVGQPPSRAAVYFSDAARRPHRVGLATPAADLNWARSTDVVRVRRTFRIPTREHRPLAPVLHSELELRRLASGKVSVERPQRTQYDQRTVVATLARGSERDLWVRESYGLTRVLVGRFEQEPSARVLTVSASSGGIHVVSPAPSNDALRSMTVSSDVAYREGDDIVVLVRQPSGASPAFVEQRINAPGGSGPVLGRSVIYFSDAGGSVRSVPIDRRVVPSAEPRR